MSDISPAALERNAILVRLPPRELQVMRRRLTVMHVDIREQVYEPGRRIPHVFFPIDAVFSVVAIADQRIAVEVATVGREGMVGLPLFLGASKSPHAAFCQVAGMAARMSADDFLDVLSRDGVMHALLRRFAQSTMVQIAQGVVCNNAHPLEKRMARWLLTTQDRVGRSEFSLTQEFLGQMLGATRQTVSVVARRLESSGMITYTRGRLQITDRRRLEALACHCYGIVRAEFQAMIDGVHD